MELASSFGVLATPTKSGAEPLDDGLTSPQVERVPPIVAVVAAVPVEPPTIGQLLDMLDQRYTERADERKLEKAFMHIKRQVFCHPQLCGQCGVQMYLKC